MNQFNEAQKKKYAEVIAKAWSDEGFKKKLIENPEKTLREMGLNLPSGKHIKVCDGTGGTYYLVIPQKPNGKLSEEELRKISGGGIFFC